MSDYISLAALEQTERIGYRGVQPGSERFHRRRMQTAGREVYVSPREVRFEVETTGFPGVASSWWHHLYPDKKLNGVKGRGIKLQERGMILWGEQRIIHMSPKGTNSQIAKDLEVSVTWAD